MQTTKTPLGDKFVYLKPRTIRDAQGKIVSRYVPIKKHRNNWYFANLTENISEQILAIGEEYNRRVKSGNIKHMNKFPIQLQRYFYFLYLTGARSSEPIFKPLSINLENVKGHVIAKIIKVNEKHKNPDGSRHPQMTQAIPIFNSAEQRMWNFITDGGSELNTEHIFQFEGWKSTTKMNLSGLIKTNFKTDLRDPITRRVHKDTGITPHILRHMRVYNVLVNYKVPETYAVMFFGWNDSKMLYYYAHLQETVSFRNQVEMLEKGDWLTGLKIDLMKSVMPM